MHYKFQDKQLPGCLVAVLTSDNPVRYKKWQSSSSNFQGQNYSILRPRPSPYATRTWWGVTKWHFYRITVKIINRKKPPLLCSIGATAGCFVRFTTSMVLGISFLVVKSKTCEKIGPFLTRLGILLIVTKISVVSFNLIFRGSQSGSTQSTENQRPLLMK